MAPFRGRGRGRGGSRGGRGGRGRGGASDKLARSGIRTNGGYRKFDSQRVKDVDASESEDGEPEVAEENGAEDEELSEDDEVGTAPALKAYNTLLQSFKPQAEENGGKRKRRKIEVEEEAQEVNNDGDAASDEGAGVEVEEGSEDDSEEPGLNGENGHVEDEEEEDTADPSEVRFANPDDNELSQRLKAIQGKEWRTEKQNEPSMGNLTVFAPICVHGNVVRKASSKMTGELPLKKRLTTSAQTYLPSLDELQQKIAPYLFNYTDLLLGNRTPQNAVGFRDLACLHALNHVLKGRNKIVKNNARLAHSENANLDLRDQGFTRPKVLILLETRQMCVKFADTITRLFAPEQQENKQRFLSSFSSPIDDASTMPEDYRELFEGNNDNNFLTALKFTRKTIKFYSPFYTSDIILASPLGLHRVLENEDVKKRDHDFLSSIELTIVDQANAMQMQNWSHVETVFQHLNLQLKEAHGCDFSRVRNWYLDGKAKYLRQTVVMSAYITPEMNKLFNTHFLNISGKIKLIPTYSGAIASASGTGVKQTFARFPSSSPTADPDDRFKFFTSTILSPLLRLPKPTSGGKGILIYIPTYYDFLRLRNFFATSTLTQNISFGTIHEYSSVPEQRRARAHFLSGRHEVLLYTERAHHFYRLRLRGVRRVVCYGVPTSGVFYEEVVGGFLGRTVEEGEGEVAARCLFSRWEGLALERVVGTGRVKGMLSGTGDTFEFV